MTRKMKLIPLWHSLDFFFIMTVSLGMAKKTQQPCHSLIHDYPHIRFTNQSQPGQLWVMYLLKLAVITSKRLHFVVCFSLCLSELSGYDTKHSTLANQPIPDHPHSKFTNQSILNNYESYVCWKSTPPVFKIAGLKPG